MFFIFNSRHGKEVDWWSFGILIHDMLTGSPPFTGNNRKTITERVLRGKLQLKNYLTPNAKDIIKRLLNRSVEKRLGAGERDALAIKEHRFFTGVKWAEVLGRRVKPPFLPQLKGEDDVSNFDDEFTSKPAIDSPPGKPVTLKYQRTKCVLMVIHRFIPISSGKLHYCPLCRCCS